MIIKIKAVYQLPYKESIRKINLNLFLNYQDTRSMSVMKEDLLRHLNQMKKR